jgi:hypothetical protein
MAAAKEAKRAGWVCARVTCAQGMLDQIAKLTEEKSQIPKGASGKAMPQVTPSETKEQACVRPAFLVSSVLGEISEPPQPATADTAAVTLGSSRTSDQPFAWQARMKRALDALDARGQGLLITVDDVDSSNEELPYLTRAHQLYLGQNRKVALILAGTPARVNSLFNPDAPANLHGAQTFELGPISDASAEACILATFESGGKPCAPEAAAHAARAAAGDPYMLQLVGWRMWQCAAGAQAAQLEHTREACHLAQLDYDNNVLHAALGGLSDGDVAFLLAMLPDAGPTKTADIAQRLDHTKDYVSQYRRRLLERGIIAPAGRGKVAFALPHMEAYLHTRAAQNWALWPQINKIVYRQSGVTFPKDG